MSHLEEENDDKIETILIATMYNVYCDKNEDIGESFDILYLKPIDLSVSDLFSLFYSTGSKKFCINKTHIKNDSITLSKQFVSSDNTYFSMREMLDIFEIGVNDMSSRIIFELQKEVKAIDSLANITGTCSSLSWEQLSSLIEDKYSNRKVDKMFVFFQIKLVYWSNVLQRDFTIVFQYNVCVEEIIQYIGSETDSLTRYKNNYNERRKEKTANVFRIISKELKLSKKEVVIERSTQIDNNTIYDETTNTSTNIGKIRSIQENNYSINRPSIISEKKRVNTNFSIKPQLKLQMHAQNSRIRQQQQQQPQQQQKPQIQKVEQHQLQSQPLENKFQNYYEQILNSVDKNDNIMEYDDYYEDYNEYD